MKFEFKRFTNTIIFSKISKHFAREGFKVKILSAFRLMTDDTILSHLKTNNSSYDSFFYILRPTSGSAVTLKTGRREVQGSNPGRACRPSCSEFSVVFSETCVNTG